MGGLPFLKLLMWKWKSCSVVSDSLRPHGVQSPWNSPGQNTGVGSLSFLQGIFPTQGLNSGLSHCRHILYQLSHRGSLSFSYWYIRLSSPPHYESLTLSFMQTVLYYTLYHVWTRYWEVLNWVKEHQRKKDCEDCASVFRHLLFSLQESLPAPCKLIL